MTQPQARDAWSPREWKRQKEFSPRAIETLIPDFWPPELREKKFLFSATKFVKIFLPQPQKLISLLK